MKIALFSDTFYPQVNGVSHFVFHLAENLAKRGHQIKVFSVTSSDTYKKLDFKKLGFDLINVPSIPSPVYRGENFRLTVPAGWTLRQLKKFKPDIIHTHTPFAIGIEAIIGAKILKIPLIGEHHTFYDHYLKHVKMDYNWGKKLSWKITVGYYNRCDMVVSPSKSLAEDLKKHGLKKPICVIPNSIDADLFCPLSKDERNKIKTSYGISGKSVVYMGRISYEKNIAQAIRAFATLIKNDSMKDVKMMLIGCGPEEDKLKKLIKELGIEKNVIWTGLLRGKELAGAMACNDVFITASRSENMPLSLLEATASGLPMVGVRENGVGEIIKDEDNGYLTKTDGEKELSEKLKNILENENKREEFGKKSRELAMDYSKEKVMDLFEKCFQETINKFKQQ